MIFWFRVGAFEALLYIPYALVYSLLFDDSMTSGRQAASDLSRCRSIFITAFRSLITRHSLQYGGESKFGSNPVFRCIRMSPICVVAINPHVHYQAQQQMRASSNSLGVPFFLLRAHTKPPFQLPQTAAPCANSSVIFWDVTTKVP